MLTNESGIPCVVAAQKEVHRRGCREAPGRRARQAATTSLRAHGTPSCRERGARTALGTTVLRLSKSEEATRTPRALPPGEMVTIRWSEVRGQAFALQEDGVREGLLSGGASAHTPVQVQLTLAELVPSELVHCDYKATGFTELPEEGLVRVHFKVRCGRGWGDDVRTAA